MRSIIIQRLVKKGLFVSALLLNLVFSSPEALPQEKSNGDSFSKAEVILDGYRLFYVRGISSFPAEQRALVISNQIKLIAQQPALHPKSIRIFESKEFNELKLGDIIILRVFDADASIEGISRNALSLIIMKKITEAVYAYRYERTSGQIITRSLQSLVAVILFVLGLLIINFLSRRFNNLLEKRLRARFEKLESQSFHIIRSSQVWIVINNLMRVVKFLFILVTAFLTIQYVLGLFPWSRYISGRLLDIFIKPFNDIGIAIINFIPNLAFLVVIFFITKYSLKIVKLLFHGLSEGNFSISGFQPEWAIPSYKIIRIFIVAFTIIVAYPYIPGSESAAFKGVSVFLGILFSLGSSSVIANIIAGYTMTYRRTFKLGDIVQIDNHIGKITEVKLFVTRMTTLKNEEIIIPNSTVLNNTVVNYSTKALEKGLILYTTVGIGYETPWRLVDNMLKIAADRTEGVLKEPKPFVFQKSLGDFAVTYELNVYTNDPGNRMNIYTRLHQNILDVFNTNNVQIMTPAYEGDPEQPKIVPKDKWFTPAEREPGNGISDQMPDSQPEQK